MSDLQCAVTVLVADVGVEQARRLAAVVADRRVASVWCGADDDAGRAAQLVAAALGVRVSVRAGLGRPGCDDDHHDDTVTRFGAVLEEVADTHRGETALLVTHRWLMAMVLPAVATNLRVDHALGNVLPGGAVVELAGDADGWVCRSWAGHRFG
jgi:probable phosphoglycerate mutase